MKTQSWACATVAMTLIFTLCAFDSARSQNPPAPSSTISSSAVVPLDHWAYQALDTIQLSGISIADSKGSPIGQSPMTRHDFAEVTARLLRLLNANTATNPDLTTQQKALESKIEGNQQALDALLSLTDEFTPELKAMGVDVAGAKARLHQLEEHLAATEAKERRVKIGGPITFIARDIITFGPGTAPLDRNGYRVVSAGSHQGLASQLSSARRHIRAVPRRHRRVRHRHRLAGHQIRNRS